MFKVEEILQATGGVLLAGDSRDEVRGISIDSRTIRNGELFLAIKGERFDGHRFVRKAVEKGASGVIVARRILLLRSLLAKWRKNKGRSPQLIAVDDTNDTLGELAGFNRSRFSGTLVAVTGSNGKTTTKEMLGRIFSREAPTLRTDGTKNNYFGVSLTLLRLEPRYRFAVVEMGMNHEGEIRQLARIARPEAAVITGIGYAHLGQLRTKAAIARAKCELLEEMGKGKIAVVNADHPQLLKRARKFGVRLVTFGLREKGADFTAGSVESGPEGLRFRVNGGFPVRMRVLGEQNVYNALAAWCAASALGIGKNRIREALENFTPPPMRMEIQHLDGVMIINDAYNSNPESFSYSLRALAGIDGGRRKVLVAGDMLELGEKSELLHRRLGEKAARSGVDLLICAGGYSSAVRKGAIRAGLEKNSVFSFARRTAAERLLLRRVRPGDVVLVKGSRRMEMEKVVAGLARRLKART